MYIHTLCIHICIMYVHVYTYIDVLYISMLLYVHACYNIIYIYTYIHIICCTPEIDTI